MFYEFNESAGWIGRTNTEPAQHYRDGVLVAPIEAYASMTAVELNGVAICQQEIDVRGRE